MNLVYQLRTIEYAVEKDTSTIYYAKLAYEIYEKNYKNATDLFIKGEITKTELNEQEALRDKAYQEYIDRLDKKLKEV